MNKNGSPESDCHEVEEQLKQEIINRAKNNTLHQFLFNVNQPLIKLEKDVWEPIDDWLKNAAIIQIFAKLSPILEAIGVLLIPVVIWLFTHNNEQIKEQQQKEMWAQQAVENYLAQISYIVAQDKLEENGDLKKIIRATTLTLFKSPHLQINPERKEKDRKKEVIEFLLEMNLIKKSPKFGLNKSAISLQEINLSRVNLQSAKLPEVDLYGVDLYGANLKEVNLHKASLHGANLKGANLRSAKLSRTNLGWAVLSEANLSETNLSESYLFRANLSGANLSGANLSRANLFGADLSGADLSGANLSEALYTDKNTKPEICNILFLQHPCPTNFPKNFNPKDAGMVLIKPDFDIK